MFSNLFIYAGQLFLSVRFFDKSVTGDERYNRYRLTEEEYTSKKYLRKHNEALCERQIKKCYFGD